MTAELHAFLGRLREEVVEDIYGLTAMQQGMLSQTLRAPDTGVYVDQWLCELDGDLDTEAFHRAWRRTVRRHDALRSSFWWRGLDAPVQIVWGSVTLPWSSRDLRGPDLDQRLREFLRADRERGFDCTVAPLMRFSLLRVADEHFLFCWTCHHSILDGWSLPIVSGDVFGTANGRPKGTIRKQRTHFGRFVRWLETQHGSATRRSAAKRYWENQLKELPPTAPWPWIGQRESSRDGSQTEIEDFPEVGLAMGAELSDQIGKLARRCSVTPSTVYTAAWLLVLGACLGTVDVVVGVTCSGRTARIDGVEDIVGNCLNTLPLRVRFRAHASVASLLWDVQETMLALLEHEWLPLIEIQRAVRKQQAWATAAAPELFQSILVFEDVCSTNWTQAFGCRVENVRWVESTELPLTLCFTTGTNTHARLTYNPGQLDHASCHRTLERLRAALECLVRLDPDAPDLGTLGVLAPEERLLLTTERPESVWPASTVHELFERQAAATPEAPAIRDGAAVLSYADLERRSRGLAAILRARGIGPECRVGIAQARSWRMIASVLGVLRSGAAYVPLDERWPTASLCDEGGRVAGRPDRPGQLAAARWYECRADFRR
jgi:hypothetical protein